MYQQVPVFFRLWLVYIIGLILISLSINQISPFFIWSMYAKPEPTKDLYTFPVVIYNQEKLATEPFYRDFYKMHIQYPLNNYLNYQQAGNKDSHKEKAILMLGEREMMHRIYPNTLDWEMFFEQYAKMLFNKTDEVLYTLEVKEVEVIFNPNGYPELTNEKILYEHK